MEQKDYLLREIEKIGSIIRAILQRAFGGNENFAVKFENQFEEEKGMLLNEINFDLDKFILLDAEESDNYLSNIQGFNTENTELLAQFIAEIGFTSTHTNSKQYLKKALQLYELARIRDKTYSVERERKIFEIIEAIK